MKIVTPSEAADILQEKITNNESTKQLTFAFRPDYKLDKEGISRFVQLIKDNKGYTNRLNITDDIDSGLYILNKDPYITINLYKIDWDGSIVSDYDFPEMGSAIGDIDFRTNSYIALTVDVDAGYTLDITWLANTPNAARLNINVAWGDSDTYQTYTPAQESNPIMGNSITHTYNEGGRYTIFVQGDLWRAAYWGTREEKTKVKAIQIIKPIEIVTGRGQFAEFTNLEYISGVISLEPDVESIDNTSGLPHSNLEAFFLNNSKLVNVKGLKIKLSNAFTNSENQVKSISQTFSNTKKELINDITFLNYDRHAIENINGSFLDSDINVFPIHLFGRNVKSGSSAFENCPNINYVPAHRFENLERAYKMFSISGAAWPSGCPTSLSPEIKFPNLKNGEGMFMNRLLSFDDIKRVFESLPKNPNPPSTRGKTGFTALDNVNPGDYCITFSFDINEPHIKEKLIKYFRLNSNAAIKYHKTMLTGWEGGGVIDLNKQWDGGWYPVYWTAYGNSWDYNNSKGWFVSFHNPNNYPGK